MIKKTITIFLFVFGFYVSHAQYTFEHIFKDSKHQIPGNIIETSNGDFIFSIITAYSNDSLESKIMKIDKEGHKIDSIVVSDVSNILYTLIKYDESCFFVCGEWNVDNKYFFWLRKYDNNFQLLKELSVPISGHSNVIYNPIIINKKKNLVVSISSQSTQTNSEVHLFEINTNCEIINSTINTSGLLNHPDEIIQKDNSYYLFFSGFYTNFFV